MRRSFTCFVLLLTLAAPVEAARAAGSTAGPPPKANKEGGIAGDPRGAIRALGGTSQTDFNQGSNEVSIPHLGAGPGRGDVGGTPPGTTGPR